MEELEKYLSFQMERRMQDPVDLLLQKEVELV